LKHKPGQVAIFRLPTPFDTDDVWGLQHKERQTFNSTNKKNCNKQAFMQKKRDFYITPYWLLLNICNWVFLLLFAHIVAGADLHGGYGVTRIASSKNYTVYVRSNSIFMCVYIKMNPLNTCKEASSVVKGVQEFPWTSWVWFGATTLS